MTKHTVLLVYGGESSQHEVSIKSALNVYAALDSRKYNVELCYIDKSGRWWSVENVGDSHVGRPQLVPALGQKQLISLPEGHSIRPDIIFPILHGKNGEDGTIQGLATLLHVPYVGPSVLGASVTMDKDMTKRLARDEGIDVIPWLLWDTNEPPLRYDFVREELGETVFVKPSHAGSSIGVSRVTNKTEWKDAIELASQHDNEILIEKAVPGNEYQISVLGNEKPEVSQVCEIVIGAAFHDFEDKYSADSAAQFHIPARLTDKQTESLRDAAKRVYRATGGRGMARIDFLADGKGKFYLNEINSIPGFTSVSVYPRLWHEAGLSYSKLIDKLIELALERQI